MIHVGYLVHSEMSQSVANSIRLTRVSIKLVKKLYTAYVGPYVYILAEVQM